VGKATESVAQYDSDTIMNKWNDLFLQLVLQLILICK
jgi:hypothetical protein